MPMIPLVAVVGPTASGKTRLAVEIALHYGGEVVSADSMQVYRGMDIGTAKPTQAEMRGVPHHMIDVAEPGEPFSVAEYARMARECIREIHARGRLPILAGGTGLYVRSVVGNIQFGEAGRDENLRRQLRALAREKGGEALLDILREFDPESAERLHPNNLNRIIRAIEVYRTSGVTITEQQRRSRQSPPPYRACIIGLYCSNRSTLYRRIDERVDRMLEAGLLKEVERLLKVPGVRGSTAMQAIGYKEFADYFDGAVGYEAAVEAIKRESRRYAKRQLTWFRREPGIVWLDAESGDYENICKLAIERIDNSGIL